MPNNRKKKTKQNQAMSEAKRKRIEEEAALRKKAKRKKLIIVLSAILAVALATVITVAVVLANKVYYSKHLTDRNIDGHEIALISMEIEGYGEVILLLDGTTAPITTDNFVKLVNEGFYDGKTFHRIVKGFMIQGGDPDATGGGGLEDKIKGEFTNNGVYNTLSHIRGTISMARSEDKNSASCQFFICNSDATSLDGSYAAFGFVMEGLEIIDKVTDKYLDATNHAEDKPKYGMYGGTITDKSKQPVIKSCRVLESYTSPVTKKTYVTNFTPTVSVNDDDKCEYYYTRSVADHDIKKAVLTVKDYGEVTLLLDATTAPETVNNFVKLVNEGFYNGKTFHRIIEGFMIQGGDPNANGTGSTDPIKGEFENNGHENDISHIRGVISMARSGSTLNPSAYYNTGSCQFFICHDTATHLDGDYAAFGYVIEGMEVIDRVIDAYKGNAVKGIIENKDLQPIISSIVIKN